MVYFHHYQLHMCVVYVDTTDRQVVTSCGLIEETA